MEYRASETLALEKYGLNGRIVLEAPTFRRRNELNNELSRRLTIEQTRNGARTQNIPAGDWNILTHLVYVKEAPFSPDMESFLKWTDVVERDHPGAVDALWADIQDAIKRIDSGASNPLEGSQGRETPLSE